jgi:hypothetical protein
MGVKVIVLREFGVLFMNSLDRYKVGSWARSEFFFHFNKHFYFEKFVIRSKEHMILLIMELLLSGGFFVLPHITAV